MSTINVKNVEADKKNKVIFALRTKGSTLSEEVRKLVDQIYNEYEKVK